MTDRPTRRYERDSLFLVAELRVASDGAPYRVKLRNISDAGLMAEGAMPVARGSVVWIDLRNVGWISGTVAWTAGDRCGVAFEQEIDASCVQFPVQDVDMPVSPVVDLVAREQEER